MRTFRRLLAAMVAICSMCVAVAGTGSTGGHGATLLNVSFVQDFPPPGWVGEIPWDVAQAKGFYQQNGLSVTMNWPPTPSDSMKFVANHTVDMGMSYTTDILTGAANGLKVIAVASLFDQDCGGVMAWADEVRTPADFKGKTVAIYDFPQTQLHFRTMLLHAGVQPSEVHIVSAGNNSTPLMLANKVAGADAAAPGELVNVVTATKRKVVFFPYSSQYGVPKRYWSVIVANPTFAKEHPAAVKAFVAATFKGLHYALSHVNEALAINRPISKQSALQAQLSWVQLKYYSFTRFSPNRPEGYMDTSIWQSYENFYLNNHLLPSSVDVKSIVTNAYLPSSSSM